MKKSIFFKLIIMPTQLFGADEVYVLNHINQLK